MGLSSHANEKNSYIGGWLYPVYLSITLSCWEEKQTPCQLQLCQQLCYFLTPQLGRSHPEQRRAEHCPDCLLSLYHLSQYWSHSSIVKAGSVRIRPTIHIPMFTFQDKPYGNEFTTPCLHSRKRSMGMNLLAPCLHSRMRSVGMNLLAPCLHSRMRSMGITSTMVTFQDEGYGSEFTSPCSHSKMSSLK